jgi:hypothetical protein
MYSINPENINENENETGKLDAYSKIELECLNELSFDVKWENTSISQ